MKRNQNMVFLLMALTCILLIGGFLFISTIYAYTANTIYTDTLCAAQLNILQQFESTYSLLLDSLATLPNMMAKDTTIRKLARMQSIRYMDDLLYALDKADQILFSNENISNVCIYLPSSGRLFSTRYGAIAKNHPRYGYIADWFEQENASQLTLRVAYADAASRQAQSYTLLLMRLSLGQAAPNFVVAIDIEHTEMFKDIIDAFSSAENAMVYVFEDGDAIFATANTVPLVQADYSDLLSLDSASGSSRMRVDGVEYMASFVHIRAQNRFYLSMIEAHYAYTPFQSMLALAALASLGVVLVCVGLSVAFSRRAMRQISSVMTVLYGHVTNPEEGGPDFLLKSVTGLVSENVMLQKRIYASLPELRENFLRNVTSRKADHYADVEPLMKALEVPVPMSPLCLAIMESDDRSLDTSTINDAVMHISVVSLMDDFFCHKKISYANYQSGNHEYVLIVDMTAVDIDALWGLFSELQEHLRDAMGLCASFIICNDVTNIHGLHDGFEYCRRMQKYKLLYKRGVILSGSSPSPPAGGEWLYPQHAENRLVGCMQNEDMQGAIECLEDILRYFTHVNSPLLIQHFIGQLFARFKALLDEHVKCADDVLSQHDYFEAFELARSFEDVRDGLAAAIEAVMNALSTDTGSAIERKCQDILAYLRANYTRNVSLDDLCGDLNISKSYINQLLHTGVRTTFVQALTEIRMDNACKLLIGTDMPITAIAEQVGFASSSYFIQTFKKLKGVTPGQFRFKRSGTGR